MCLFDRSLVVHKLLKDCLDTYIDIKGTKMHCSFLFPTARSLQVFPFCKVFTNGLYKHAIRRQLQTYVHGFLHFCTTCIAAILQKESLNTCSELIRRRLYSRSGTKRKARVLFYKWPVALPEKTLLHWIFTGQCTALTASAIRPRRVFLKEKVGFFRTAGKFSYSSLYRDNEDTCLANVLEKRTRQLFKPLRQCHSPGLR